MTIQETKNIKLADYLSSLGFNPVKQQGCNLWYKSPFRVEQEASFKVNTDRNEWYDFGMGKGGNIIALAAELYNTNNVSDLLRHLEAKAPSIHPVAFSFQQQVAVSGFQNLEVVPLAHPALLRYLEERKINVELAKRECKELHFVSNGKPYFAVGFQNVSGGYEVRNPFFKGCIAPKNITLIQQQEKRNTCFVFEGFMDYLSFLTIRKQRSPEYPDLNAQDYLVLNSTSNLSKALYPLADYERIHCFLDNDNTGRKAVEVIQNEYGLRVRDSSHLYNRHKDLNDYLCGKRLVQSVDLTQPPKQTQSANNSNKQEQQPPKKKSRGFRM